VLDLSPSDPISPLVPQRLIPLDDLAAPFQIEDQLVRGRLVRLGPSVDEVLTRHDYPAPVANLLGETCALAALVGNSLKFEGRLIVQAQGDGPVSYVVADYDTEGSLRGYCRYDEGRLAALRPEAGFKAIGAQALLGQGVFIMTIDQGADTERYQGVTPIEGETLAFCAERYFAQSEQTPTRVRLAVGQVDHGPGPKWRAGGILLQNVAEDDARGETAEAWREAQFLFETVGEDELIDPTLTPETLLYRLFHEQGVRLFAAQPLKAFCRCNEERILTVLQSFGPAERAEMVEADGNIHVTCEYCSRIYKVGPEAVG
jgi:molecular chaperone Hsp33